MSVNISTIAFDIKDFNKKYRVSALGNPYSVLHIIDIDNLSQLDILISNLEELREVCLKERGIIA